MMIKAVYSKKNNKINKTNCLKDRDKWESKFLEMSKIEYFQKKVKK